MTYPTTGSAHHQPSDASGPPGGRLAGDGEDDHLAVDELEKRIANSA